MKNLRAAASWIGTPVGLVAVWLLFDWFFSTTPGATIGVIIGVPLLIALAAGIAWAFYAFRK